MLTTFKAEIEAVGQYVNKFTGYKLVPIEAKDLIEDRVIAVVYVPEDLTEQGVTSSFLSYSVDGDMHYFAVTDGKNIIEITDDVDLVMLISDAEGVRENIAKFGVEDGIKKSEDVGILTSGVFYNK